MVVSPAAGSAVPASCAYTLTSVFGVVTDSASSLPASACLIFAVRSVLLSKSERREHEGPRGRTTEAQAISMGTLEGVPNPPALWLGRVKPAYAHANTISAFHCSTSLFWPFSMILNCTRRFFCRPSGVSFSAMGSSMP